MTLKKTVNLFTGLALVFQFHLNCMKLKSAQGKSYIVLTPLLANIDIMCL